MDVRLPPQDDAPAMAAALVVVSLVGSGLCVVSTVADLTPDEHRSTVIALSVLGVLFSLVVLALRRRCRPWVFSRLALPGAIAQLSVGIWVSGDPANPAAVLYVLLALFAGFFFSRRTAVALVALSAAAYGAVLVAIADPALALDRWMFTVTATVGIGLVVTALRDRLVAQARTDALTGLANRAAFETALARAAADRRPFAVLIADVDELKTVNDERGHAAGDDELRAAARALTAAVRPGDLVARFGGDEFGVLLQDGDAAAVRSLGERVLAGPEGPSLSVGAALAPGGRERTDTAALLRAADGALYAAKRAGRRRLELAEDDGPALVA